MVLHGKRGRMVLKNPNGVIRRFIKEQATSNQDPNPDIPEKWKKLISLHTWVNEFKNSSSNIEIFHKWMTNPNKERFINWKDDDIGGGRTMLFCALELEQLDIAKLLLEHGADINISNRNQDTPLMDAANRGRTEIVGFLLDKGADINVADKKGNTALMYAFQRGHTGVVKLLMEKGADLNIANKDGDTVFMKAFQGGQIGPVELLLEKGADCNIANKNGETALMKASRWGRTDMVELMLEKGAADPEIADKTGKTALMMAASSGRTDTVKLLLERGVDINSADKDGMTALILACENLHIDTAALLVDKGADLDIANEDGETALMIAFEGGNMFIVGFLLEEGADYNIANKKGETIFTKAFQLQQAEIMKLLLDRGANINIAEKDGWDVFIWAFEKGYTKTLERLLDTSDLNVTNKDDGDTALIKACIDGHAYIVKRLLDKGADCKISNNQGRTAFTEAYYQGKADIVDLLLDKAPLKDIVHDVVKFPHFANKFLELYRKNRDIVNWLDDEGRTVRQMACKECREAILFMGQYDLDDQPMYESPTCKIYNALDYGNPDEPNLEQPRHVAMKFMEKVEHFLNEMRTRRNDDGSQRFSSEFVTPDFAAYRADQDPKYAKECNTFSLPKYCLVMPRAERSLLEAMNAEYLSAKHKDLQRREILLTLCKIFSYLHEMGYVHGDIKPHNVVRHMDGHVTWKAIDFDACTKIGDVVGMKLTTGSAPPEMLKIVKGEETEKDSAIGKKSKIILRQRSTDGLDESELVRADPSFDVWSYGILLYQLVTGRSFFHCDLQGNLDDAGLQELASLTQRLINQKLTSVEDVNARVLLSRILRLDHKERPTMSDIGKDYYFHPSESPQGRKSDFIGKQVLPTSAPQGDAVDFDDMHEDSLSDLEANKIIGTDNDDDDDRENVEELGSFLSSKSEFSYFKLRDEDKDWSDKLLNSEVETFRFDKLEGMGEKPMIIDGDSIYNNSFLRGLLSTKGPDYFMGFLVEYFELYKIMSDAHQVCQEIKANLVSDVKSLKGIFIKLFVRGKGLNDIVRGTLFCNSVDLFMYVGRQLKEQYGHYVYIKPPKQEAGAWPIPKLLVYGKKQIDGRCMSVEIQFSTVYMHLAVHASNNHLVYEAMRESTGYLIDKDKDFLEFLQSLNRQYIDTEGFLRNQSAQEGRFEILVDTADQESDKQYVTKANGFILSGRICCGNKLMFRFLSPTDRFQRFSESSFVVNRSLTLLSSHSYWSDESYDLEGRSVEFVVSFKGRGLVIAGIGTAKCLHGSMESDDFSGTRCSVHVARSKFVVRKSGVEEVLREKKLPDQERAKIGFKMKDGVLSVSFAGSERDGDDEETESVQVSMPSDQRYFLYIRAPPGVHDIKFHDINIK